MKKNIKLTLLALGCSSVFALGTLPVHAEYDPNTNTETLTNNMVSETRGNTAIGDYKSYEHPDRDLVINWTHDNNRGDGSAIRDAIVKVKNLTINTDFVGNQWDDKAVICDKKTHITATGDINITSHDDAIYTEADGTTTIDGFKNLNIKATGQAYGIVDNGKGITIKGGEGSTVKVRNMSGRPAVGNAGFFGAGKQISISSDTIDIASEGDGGVAVGASMYSANDPDKRFDVSLEGKLIKLAGEHSIQTFGNAHVAINQNTVGTVQLDGGVDVNAGSVKANMAGKGSYLKAAGTSDTEITALNVGVGGLAEFNISSDDSYILGDLSVTGASQDEKTKSQLTVNASGKNFKMSRVKGFENSLRYTGTSLVEVDYKANADLNLTGENAEIEGTLNAHLGGTIQLNMSGKNGRLIGDLETKLPTFTTTHLPDDNAKITANFSGENAIMKGNILTNLGGSTVEANFSGKNATLQGNASAKGTNVWSKTGNQVTYYIGKNNHVNLNFTGENSSQTGDLIAEGENTLEANYLGKGSSLTGNVDNKGIMNLKFAKGTFMQGDMKNSTKTLMDNSTFDGKLTVDFDGAAWKGDLDVVSGTATIGLKNESLWTGFAKGTGDVNIDATSRWNVTKDSMLGTLALDAGGVVSLAGTAKTLTMNKLAGNGGGTFVMDLHYNGNDVDAYRNGATNSDFLIAKEGNGNTYKVDLTADSSVDGMVVGSKLYFATTGANSSIFKVNDAVQLKSYKSIYDKSLVVKKETDSTGSAYDGHDNWFLTAAGAPGPSINPNGTNPGTAYATALSIWRDEDTLLKRLGELRYNPEKQGVWARLVNKRLERDGEHSFSGNYKGLQVGWDKEKVTTNNGNWYYGAAIDHIWGDSTYSAGIGNQKATAVSFYGTNLRDSGHYVDIVARIGKILSEYDSSYTDHGSFGNWGTTVSAEYGRKQMMNEDWSIETQGQLTYSYLWGDDYTTRNGAKVHQDNADSLVGRLGFVVSREYDSPANKPHRVYFKASLMHDFLGGTTSQITDGSKSFTGQDKRRDTWVVVGLGTDIRFADNRQFYFDVERTFGADIQTKYRFNTGLRVAF